MILHTKPGACSGARRLIAIAAAVLTSGGFFWADARAQTNGAATARKATDAVPLEVAETLPNVVIQGHYENGVGTSDAASQGSVNGALLEDIPLLRPGEVLETVPGLVVTQHSGDGKANQYFLRGYNLDHGTDFASFVDGVPVNMPTNAHGQGYSDLNYLIPELVERIDYLKGPYFAETGDFSSAGSARIRYKSRLDQNFADLTAGSYGFRRSLVAASFPLSLSAPDATGLTALPSADPTLLTALELQNSNGPWTVPEDLQKVNGLMRMSQGDAAHGWSGDVQYYNAHWNSTDQVPLELIESGRLGRYAALDPTDGGSTGRKIVSGEWHDHDDAGYTKISGYAQQYRLQLFSNFTFFELRPATGDQFQQVEHRNFFGTQLAHGWIQSPFGLPSTTEVGLQLRHDNVHVALRNTEARVPFQTVSDDQVGETGTGLYVQNTTTWTSWLRTLAGLRQDHVSMNLNAMAIPANSGHASGGKTSPKLSLIFGPWYRTEFFANAGRGFHSNDARGVIGRIDSTTGLPSDPVPALVGSKGKELGLRTEAIEGLQSSLALWSLDSDSELVYAADSGIGSTSPNGASKRYGVEWNNHMVLARNFLFDADLAWTHARYATNNDNGALGDYISNAVSKVALFRATAQRLGPWSVGLETRYIGAYPVSQDGTLTAPSALVTNLRVHYTIASHVGLQLDLLNLFNRQYYDIAYQQDYQVSPTAAAVPSGITVHPGEPRELRMTLNLRF